MIGPRIAFSRRYDPTHRLIGPFWHSGYALRLESGQPHELRYKITDACLGENASAGMLSWYDPNLTPADFDHVALYDTEKRHWIAKVFFWMTCRPADEPNSEFREVPFVCSKYVTLPLESFIHDGRIGVEVIRVTFPDLGIPWHLWRMQYIDPECSARAARETNSKTRPMIGAILRKHAPALLRAESDT